MLGHKLKHTQIKVNRDYDRSLPQLIVHGSELNQVWTNLIDNAIDALGEKGTITVAHAARRRLRARRHRRRRPGHPAEARDARLRPVLHHQGRRAAAPGWAWTPRGGSSRSATAAP